MSANRRVCFAFAASAVLACVLWRQLHEQAVGEEGPKSTQHSAGDDSLERNRAEAQAMLKALRESRESADRADPDLLKVQAQQIGQQFRQAYPYTSLRNRLEYETKNRSEVDGPRLSLESNERLEQSDARFAKWSESPLGDLRAKSLEQLHSEQVAQFIAREGFGRSRMPAPANPDYLELPSAPTIPFAAAPKRSSDLEADVVSSLPRQVTRYDMLRLHAGEPTWTDEQVEDKYYNQLSYDQRMKAMSETYAVWKAKHNPLNLPSRDLFLDSHEAAVLNFAGSGRNGHVQNLDRVAGFGSHAMTSTPQFEPGPVELRYWPDHTKEAPLQWLVTRLQLVSLLKHEAPGVYVSNNLPKMEELAGADVRPLNDFEASSLEQLFQGEHLTHHVSANRIQMLGALRASKQCLQCHQVKRGDLLGAFSYELLRAKPLEQSETR